MVCTRLLELAATRGVRVCSWIGFIVQDVMVVFFFFFRKKRLPALRSLRGPLKLWT